MAMPGAVASAEIVVNAAPERVWSALTDPDQIAVYLGGSHVDTTWEVGSLITWTGEYDGHAYRDSGEVLIFDEPHVLSVTHYSPLMGQEDRPENYHTLVYTITPYDGGTRLSLVQDNCADEVQSAQFSRNWQTMLDQIKNHLEG
jgi:uncharacterized protein YndB with AHSA1/START domain